MTPLLFLHIPKAGGSTLRELLHQQFDAESVYKIESDINGDIQRLTELSSSHLAQIQLVTGHMAFGLHRFLPNAKYLTLLRDPVQRVISEYRFIFSNQHHVLNPLVSKMSLLEYLQSGLSSQISNGQTRLIAGVIENGDVDDDKAGQCGIPGTRPVLETDYQQALANLQTHFIFAGTLANYDETLLMWQRAFKWRWPFYLRKNITPKQFAAPSNEDIAAIKACNEWDIKLYEMVKNQQLATLSKQSIDFKLRVMMFKKLNQLYAGNRIARALIRRAFRLI